jgi:hypothetical protein
MLTRLAFWSRRDAAKGERKYLNVSDNPHDLAGLLVDVPVEWRQRRRHSYPLMYTIDCTRTYNLYHRPGGSQ